ncbi:MAG: GNAT family N-acetyltransferase, partial [Anaerolinea sp.]|nr:GNAT family N-acetyltransferase [Anaerolinea sp.]
RPDSDETAPLEMSSPPVTLVALEADTVLAAARLHITGVSARIDWIAGDDFEALKTLIGRIEMLALSADCVEIACGRALFGAGWYGIWGTWFPVRRVLTQAGWRVQQRWRVYTLDISALPPRREPNVPAFKSGWHMNRAAGEWIARAFSGDDEVGTCIAWALPGPLNDHPQHSRWILLEHVAVEPAHYRRRGIASALIHEQMGFQARRGVTQALATMPEANSAARYLIDSLRGYYVGDSLGFVATL